MKPPRLSDAEMIRAIARTGGVTARRARANWAALAAAHGPDSPKGRRMVANIAALDRAMTASQPPATNQAKAQVHWWEK